MDNGRLSQRFRTLALLLRKISIEGVKGRPYSGVVPSAQSHYASDDKQSSELNYRNPSETVLPSACEK